MIQFLLAGLLATLLSYLSYIQKKDIFLVFALAIMWYIAAFQDCIASDFISYKEMFDQIVHGRIRFSFFRADRDDVEAGWFMLNRFIGFFFNSFYAVSSIVYLFVFGVFFMLLKRCPSQWRWIAVFYLYFTPGWFTSIMSAERQTVAIAFWILVYFSLQKKFFLSLLICVILFFSCPLCVSAGIFKDVPDNSWYAKAVNYCYENGYMVGVSETCFGPGKNMSRAMFITIL